MTRFSDIPLGTRPKGRWALRAAWIVADTPGGRRLLRNGEVVIEGDIVIHVGPHFDGKVAGIDMAEARIRAQGQFDGLLAKYPDRTAGHPPAVEIFPPAYPLVDGRQT